MRYRAPDPHSCLTLGSGPVFANSQLRRKKTKTPIRIRQHKKKEKNTRLHFLIKEVILHFTGLGSGSAFFWGVGKTCVSGFLWKYYIVIYIVSIRFSEMFVLNWLQSRIRVRIGQKERQSGRQTEREPVRQNKRKRGSQADKQERETVRQTNRRETVSRQTRKRDSQADKQKERQTGRQTERETVRQTNRRKYLIFSLIFYAKLQYWVRRKWKKSVTLSDWLTDCMNVWCRLVCSLVEEMGD